MTSFQTLQSLLARWPQPVPEEPFEVSCHERLRHALRSLQSGGLLGAGDLAGLIRQVLYRESLQRKDANLYLRVPGEIGWPDHTTWLAHGMNVQRTLPGWYEVSAQHWEPAWLPSGQGPPLASACSEAKRRRDWSVPADPVYTDLTGHKTYISPGQREAVRAAFLMRPGTSLLVNLPTGAGKTMAIFAPALAASRDGGLTVVVVPTVALARDLARRMAELLRMRQRGQVHEMAYHGGLEAEEKAALRRRIRDGSQPIVFASPEALLGGLRGALFEAAQAGRLRYLAIDEAHLVDQWGQEFRPEFQLLSGFRAGLLTACPPGQSFRTLLLTGTLTEEAWRTLQTLFGQDELEVVSAVHLRPEPSYWISYASDEEERCRRVEEVIRHAPRPLVLYTTRREDATWWHRRLGELGLCRIGRVMGGDMSTVEGERVLAAWNAHEIDIIVATSAFGLGMDHSEVRTVVHACVPETVDRYYQEVGRAGRDGNASAAILIYTTPDLKLAEDLARDRILTVKRGLERWRAMWARAVGEADLVDGYAVPLQARPPDVHQESRANAAWNRRTLILMAQSNLIFLDAKPPPRVMRLDGEDDASYEARCREEIKRASERTVLRLKHAGHQRLDIWESVVEPVRRAVMSADLEAAVEMRALLQNPAQRSSVLRRAYTIQQLGIVPEVIMDRAYSSWIEEGAIAEYTLPRVHSLRRTGAVVTPEIRRVLGNTPLCIVSYRVPSDILSELRSWRATILRVLRRLVQAGFCEIEAGPSWLQDSDYHRLSEWSPLRFITHHDLSEPKATMADSTLPIVSVLEESHCHAGIPEQVLDTERSAHVVLIPESTPDQPRLDRRYIDVHNHIPLDILLGRLDS